jgi:hypothetical protein
VVVRFCALPALFQFGDEARRIVAACIERETDPWLKSTMSAAIENANRPR